MAESEARDLSPDAAALDELYAQRALSSPARNYFQPAPPPNLSFGDPIAQEALPPASTFIQVPGGNPGQFMDRNTGETYILDTAGRYRYMGNILSWSGPSAELARMEAVRLRQAANAGLVPTATPVPLKASQYEWRDSPVRFAGQSDYTPTGTYDLAPTVGGRQLSLYTPSDEDVVQALGEMARTGWYQRDARAYQAARAGQYVGMIGGVAGQALIPIPIVGSAIGAGAGSLLGQEIGGRGQVSPNLASAGRAVGIGALAGLASYGAGQAAPALGLGGETALGQAGAKGLEFGAGAVGSRIGGDLFGAWGAPQVGAGAGGYELNPYMGAETPAGSPYGLGAIRSFVAAHPLV